MVIKMTTTAFSPHDGIYIEHLMTDKKNDMPIQHYHAAYEIYLHLNGTRYFFYNNICYTLERGDMIILRPFDIHYAESRECEYYERYVLNFQADALSTVLAPEEANVLLESRLKPCIIRLGDAETTEMFEFFKRADMYSKRRGFLSDKLMVCAVLQLIDAAVSKIRDELTVDGEKVPPHIANAITYINESYKDDISVDDIANAACMSKHYFCRSFKRITGATVWEYLHNVRITRVHNLLINTSMTLDEIAEETGFSGAATMSRVFKSKYGVSPGKFRKKEHTTT